MKKSSVVRLVAAGSVVVGSAVGGAVTIASVGAQDDTSTTVVDTPDSKSSSEGHTSQVDEVLSGLVDDGTLTQEQADKVASALEAARPEMGEHRGHGRGGRNGGSDVIAEAIGIDEAALRDALSNGQSIAEVATANDVDPQVVIDAMVADARTRIDQAVADEDMTQAQADEKLAELTTRVTAMVNGEKPARGDRGGAGHGRGHKGHGPDASPDDAADDDAPTEDATTDVSTTDDTAGD